MTAALPAPAAPVIPGGDAIYPTHRCFDDVTDSLNDLAADLAACVSAEEVSATLRLYTVVHGILLAPDGKPYAHAWLERDGRVIQTGIYHGLVVRFSMSRAEFIECARVWDETRYTVDQTVALHQAHGPGPWVPEYRALSDVATDREWSIGEGEAE